MGNVDLTLGGMAERTPLLLVRCWLKPKDCVGDVDSD